MKRKSKPVREPRMRGNIKTIPSPKTPKKMDVVKSDSLNNNPAKNQLFYGDNLNILRKYIKDESIDLCYIDPPFNSKRNYNQIYNNVGKEDKAQAQAFVDTWTWDITAEEGFNQIIENYNGVFTKQSISLIIGLENVLSKGSLLSYLVHMTLRVAEIYRILKPTGSFYLHCDPNASHYLKLIIDSIFCSREGDFRNEMVWCYSRMAAKGQKQLSRCHDIIFWYSRGKTWTFNVDDIRLPYAASSKARAGYKKTNLGGGSPKSEICELNEIGKFPEDWISIPFIRGNEYLGYPTQKPEALLERIIKASTNEGDIVLDAYCGCGTTVAVAERLNRKWIGIDITYQSISLILKRLEEHFGISTIQNIQLNGVPQDFESAIALAHKKDDKTRKEFEKWAILTYSNNRANINEKKGGDGGIDGVAYLVDYNDKGERDSKRILFSVKSDKTLHPDKIRELFGTVQREKAAIGIMLTLYPMPNLIKESKKYGTYENKMFGHLYQKIEVISAKEIIEGSRMKLPTAIDILNKAQQKSKSKQQEIEFLEPSIGRARNNHSVKQIGFKSPAV
ncbi:MAG TPA: site-specific DNA-methyltransferase [Puia sp.]|jgi:DNA modification methylase|nr:site-specific DNA-methyltransferase [Puia sp.]